MSDQPPSSSSKTDPHKFQSPLCHGQLFPNADRVGSGLPLSELQRDRELRLMEQEMNPGADVSEQDQENGSMLRLRTRTSRDYAHRVQTHASITASESLHPGDSLRNLADFLWQPYVLRAPQIDNISEQPAISSTQNGLCFVSLYNISQGTVSRTPFETVQQFEELGQSVIPGQGCSALLLLQGYPAPEWLNALGARFGIDPEFYRRHLIFASASNRSAYKRTAGTILPSCLGDMVSLQVTRIGARQGAGHPGSDQQKKLDDLRKDISKDMATYMSKLASLNTPGVETGDSIVREFSLHGLDYFSLEQTVSLAIHPCGQGWIGIVWHDDGSELNKGLQGPWQASAIRSNSFEVTYLPTSFHTPGVVLKSRKRKTSTLPPNASKPWTKMELILDDYARNMDLARVIYDPFYALSPFFNFVVSAEMELFDLIAAKVREDLDHANLIRQDNNPTLSNLLYHQQVLKRHIQGFQAPIRFMNGLQERPWVEEMTDENQRRQYAQTIHSAVTDYQAALAYAKELEDECVQGMSIVAHNVSILEAEKAIAEARGVTKLTRLATVFVPMAFVTAVFSMNVQQINSSGPDIWWWIVTSLVVATMTWWFFKYDKRKLWCSCRKRCTTLYRDMRHARQRAPKSGVQSDVELEDV